LGADLRRIDDDAALREMVELLVGGGVRYR
jgi:hypothetical protein